jgi:hypothetical protein
VCVYNGLLFAATMIMNVSMVWSKVAISSRPFVTHLYFFQTMYDDHKTFWNDSENDGTEHIWILIVSYVCSANFVCLSITIALMYVNS